MTEVWRKKLKGRLRRLFNWTIPVKSRLIELSALFSLDDEPAVPSERLIDIALKAANEARHVSMAELVARMHSPPLAPNIWPGEHYKLLAGLMVVCKPKIVIEIGTATGLSALAMKAAMPAGSRLFTFDIVPWDKIDETVLLPQRSCGWNVVNCHR